MSHGGANSFSSRSFLCFLLSFRCPFSRPLVGHLWMRLSLFSSVPPSFNLCVGSLWYPGFPSVFHTSSLSLFFGDLRRGHLFFCSLVFSICLLSFFFVLFRRNKTSRPLPFDLHLIADWYRLREALYLASLADCYCTHPRPHCLAAYVSVEAPAIDTSPLTSLASNPRKSQWSEEKNIS